MSAGSRLAADADATASGVAPGAAEDGKVRRMPWDIEILTAVFSVMSFLGAFNGPFFSQRMDKDLRTATKMSLVFSLSSLVVSIVVSRLSDKLPRRGVLWAGFGGNLLANVVAVLVPDAWWPLIVGSCCMGAAGNVTRALFGDYCISMRASSLEIATWQSRMSICIGLPGIVAPLIGPMLLSSMEESMFWAMIITALVTPVSLLLHAPPERKIVDKDDRITLSTLLNVKSTRESAGLWYLGWCFSGVFLFQVCFVLLGPLTSMRFGNDPAKKGLLQSSTSIGSVIGAALSGPAKRRFGTPHPQKLISGFMLFTFIGRVLMFVSFEFKVHLAAYFLFGVMGVGIIGPIKDSMPTLFVPKHEIGGFIGVQRAVEAFSGVMGTVFARMIGDSLGMNLLTLSCLAVYFSVPLYAYLGYTRFMLPAVERVAAEQAKID